MDKNEVKEKISKNIGWFLEQGLIAEAEDFLRQFNRIYPGAVEYYSMQAGLELAKGNFNNAKESIRQGLLKDPYDSDLLQNSLFMASIEKNATEAVRAHALLHMLGRHDEAKFPVEFELPVPGFKVLQGTMEIANQMNTLTRSLNYNGCSAKAINYYPSYLKYGDTIPPFIALSSTRQELELNAKKFAATQIAENDIFHFHFGTSLTLDHSDLPVLRECGKTTLMHYWGSEIRRLSIAKRYNPYVTVKDFDEKKIIRQIEFIARYIDDCVVCDNELALYIKDFFKNVHILPLAIDLGKYQPVVKFGNASNIKIVHAPTHFGVKGTDTILRVIEKLSNEFPIDFKLVQGIAHHEAMKIYQQADLVIDQILIGCHGVFALECMAMGKPIICWTSDFMKTQYPSDLPVISANPDTLEKVLRHTLQNRDKLPDIGQSGREYVEKYHDAQNIGRSLLGLYRTISKK